MIFIGLKMTYDRTFMELIWWLLNRNVPWCYIGIVENNTSPNRYYKRYVGRCYNKCSFDVILML